MGKIPLRIYHLFIVFWLHWVFVAVHRFSLVWQAGASLHWFAGFLLQRLLQWSTGQTHRLQQLQHGGSVAAVCGLSCLAACGVLVHRPAIELGSFSLQDGFLTTGPPEKFENYLLFKVALLKYSSYNSPMYSVQFNSFQHFMSLCNHRHYLILEDFFVPLKIISYPLIVNPHLSPYLSLILLKP